MIDKLLEIGAGFDWISPLAGIVGDAVHGPSHTFLIPHDSCPLSGREVELMLKRRGIKTWGAMIVDGTLMISVKAKDAGRAQAMLKGAGVPIENEVAQSTKRSRNTAGRTGSPFSVFDIFR